jgi:hypothetical protein
MFPWGVPTAQTITAQSIKNTESFDIPNVLALEPYSLTTEKFDEKFVDKISVYSTDKTISWVTTKPLNYYNIEAYFTKEIITQFIVAIFLSLLLYMTIKLDNKTRILLIGISSIAAVAGIYGQMLNWWGMPVVYALGAGFNLIIGWTISAYLSSRFILKTDNNE